MKKISLVLLLSMSLCILASCGVDPQAVGSTEPPPVETPEVVYEPIILTEAHKTSMENYLRSCPYVAFIQTMENGIEGQATYSLTRYSLSVNVEQGVHSMSMRYITVDGINREGVGYKLYSDGENVLISEDGEWKEGGEEYKALAWDLSQFTNACDVFEYLLHDIKLPVGVEGTSTGEFWTFEYTEPATESLIAGIEYDELLDAKYKFTFRNVDDAVRPDSVTVRVNYKIDDVTYYVESVIQMNSFGDTKIAMPQVGEESEYN